MTQSLKQTTPQDHSHIKEKVLNHFKCEGKKITEEQEAAEVKNIEESENEEKAKEAKKEDQFFNLVLIDIHNTNKLDIKCVKKNMYEKDLKFLSISYRWGELDEQIVKTPDYTAHITSFDLNDLKKLCVFISKEPDLKDIPYLWVDAISINQHDNESKKETILKMNEIYKKATYILAVPDLHLGYLKYNPANRNALQSITNKKNTIYEDIYKESQNKSIKEKEIEKSKNKKKANELLAYGFLAYLVKDWANRVWVISEYQIAKDKEINNKKSSFKYMFVSLLSDIHHMEDFEFFSYTFDHQYTTTIYNDNDNSIENDGSNGNNNNSVNNSNNGNKYTSDLVVDSCYSFIESLRARFTQRSYIDMILNSMAARNEDRFNAILPSWNEYKDLIKDKDTVSKWRIKDMISVRFKLYEIMKDLWDNARLLHACSYYDHDLIILPSFVSDYEGKCLQLIEMDDIDHAYYIYLKNLLLHISPFKERIENFEDYITLYKKEIKSIYTENLTNIQFKHSYLSVKSERYFIVSAKHEFDQEFLLNYELIDDDSLVLVFIPFFTYSLKHYVNYPPIGGSSIYLIGNIVKNRWILTRYNIPTYQFDQYLPCTFDYIFNIY